MNYCKCGCKNLVKNIWHIGHNRKGVSFFLSDETKEKMRKSKLGILNPRFGKPGTHKGKKNSNETINKIKIARSKQVITLEMRKKISESMKNLWQNGTLKKENLSWYIDGRNENNKLIKKSFEYKIWREAVFKRDMYSCQECKKIGGELQAHHIKPQSIFPELRFAIDNGITLCRSCHMKTETWGMRLDLTKVGTQS